MTPYETYCDYIALKKHFTDSHYDYVKYNGKMRLTAASFQKRKDKLFFEKIAKHEDPHGFFIANLVVNDKAYIRDLAYSDQAEDVYKNWLKTKQSLTYNFKQDLNKLDRDLQKEFVCEDGQHPALLQKYLANEISLETLCILLETTKTYKYWCKEMEFDMVWDMLKLKVRKYNILLDYDRGKYTKLVLDFCHSL